MGSQADCGSLCKGSEFKVFIFGGFSGPVNNSHLIFTSWKVLINLRATSAISHHLPGDIQERYYLMVLLVYLVFIHLIGSLSWTFISVTIRAGEKSRVILNALKSNILFSWVIYSDPRVHFTPLLSPNEISNCMFGYFPVIVPVVN